MSATDRTRSPLRRRILLLLGILVMGVLLLEAAVRARLYLRTGSFGLAHIFQRDERAELPVPPPGRTTATQRIDSRGFRSPELELPKPDGRIRLAFLGGSTTFCAEASSNEATWPHLVWTALSEAFPDADLD